jgi:hypothetical protein
LRPAPPEREEIASSPLLLAQASPAPLATRKPAAKVPSVPPPEVLLMLMRTTLVALNQANFTGNYTVLHGLASPALQARNSPAQLGIAFTELRNLNLDLSPVLVLSPELSETPTISPEGVLRLAGHFPTRPLEVRFLMQFAPVDGRWRIDGLSVSAARVDETAKKPAVTKSDKPPGDKKADDTKAAAPAPDAKSAKTSDDKKTAAPPAEATKEAPPAGTKKPETASGPKKSDAPPADTKTWTPD